MGSHVPPVVSGVPGPHDACGGLSVPTSHRLGGIAP
jgi:hypothetical protein